MKKILLLISFLCFSFLQMQSQKLDHVLGDVLIKIYPDADVYSLEKNLEFFNGQATDFKVIREVSKPVNIWLFHFDFTTIDENAFLAHLWRQDEVEVVQFNHLVFNRQSVPDDPLFGNQWQWSNNGGGGGTPDADVDATLAWDITTGGTTSGGHDIVVCVIEAYDWDHPDLIDNHWTNEAEIPNNNVDDDNNGYIDDFNGWNAPNENDNISEWDHGTAVAGMIGAVGNNALGVTGINWDVKIMVVQMGGIGSTPNPNEANVIEAYTYPLVQRQIFNDTNGEEGAFVVATNSSWGLDGANPLNAPLWCDFYNTKGEAGILSCGATANNNVNIDVVGDLPTACDSEYMISVTATNNSDVRTFSGFGVENVDLGAPGENIYSTAVDDGPYAFTSGTSFASPLTAGVIGLMYSAPCSSLGGMSIADPGGTALMIRDLLFEGVDPIPNLADEVKTGGRVNAFNSIQLILENCGPCPAPFGVFATNITDVNADIEWVSTDSTLSTSLRWRTVGDTVWTQIDSVNTPYPLNGLQACTDYEFEFEDICSDTTSGWSFTYFFQTDGCCEAPKEVEVFNIEEDGATVNWETVLAANSYNLLLSSAEGTETFEGIIESGYQLGLEPCISYSVQIQTVCDTGMTNYSVPIEFMTPGCGACIDLTYCNSAGADSDSEWIEYVTFNTLNNTSGNDGGYGDYTGVGTEVETWHIYNLSIGVGTSNPVRIKAWLDFNQDGDFFDVGEDIYYSGNMTVNSDVSVPILIPGGTPAGLARLRVSLRLQFPSGSCGVFDFGEVEDYCITIVEADPPECLVPEDLTATNLDFEEATLSWTNNPAALSYNVQYKATANAGWINIDNAASPLVLDGLSACTEYEFQVEAVCPGSTSGFSDSFIFTTECFPPCLELPANLDTTEVNETSASLIWDATPNANSYLVRYKAIASPDWLVEAVNSNDATITGLTGCTDYHYTVQAICDSGESDFGDFYEFKTDCINSVHELASGISSLQIAPNPFSDVLNFNFEMIRNESINISLYTMDGKNVVKSSFEISSGLNQIQLEGLEDLTAGIYLIKISTNTGFAVRKAVKE